MGPPARAIIDSVSVDLEQTGAGLLDGTCEVVLRLRDGASRLDTAVGRARST